MKSIWTKIFLFCIAKYWIWWCLFLKFSSFGMWSILFLLFEVRSLHDNFSSWNFLPKKISFLFTFCLINFDSFTFTNFSIFSVRVHKFIVNYLIFIICNKFSFVEFLFNKKINVKFRNENQTEVRHFLFFGCLLFVL